MVVEAAPASSFEMSKPDLLFELLIIALDLPTQFGEVHELAEGNVFRQGRKPIFGRLFLPFGPFHQQPLFGPDFRECVISMCDTNPHASKARGQTLGRPLPPFDPAPGALGEVESELFDRDRFMLVVASKALWLLAAARPFLRRQRSRAGRPHCSVWQDTGHIGQCERADAGTQICVTAIARVHQDHAARKPGL